jgi:urease accessory protein
MICASVAIMALLALWPPQRLRAATIGLAGMFAFFHGLAHGQEAAAGVANLQFTAGLLATSSFVLAVGALSGRAFPKLAASRRR